MTFKQRSYQKELLDGEQIPFEDIKRNMQELAFINRYLGGHKITLSGVKKLIAGISSSACIRIAEIGCGGGDNLWVIKQWAEQNGVSVELTGVDINRECIDFAQQQPSNRGINFICCDYKQTKWEQPPHLLFSSLFCHHFTDEELVNMLQWMYRNCSCGFFINDLHRHPVAYYSIKVLTQCFSKSYLVKNDAPLSVKRGFVKKDWAQLIQQAGLPNVNYSWQWAFRWLVTCSK